MQAADLVSAVIGLGREEADPAFRKEVQELSRRGLSVVGLLGFVGAIFYVLTHVVALGYAMGWSYNLYLPGEKVLVMWDKLVVACLSLIAFLAARLEIGKTHGRLILALCVLGAAGGMIVDQAAGGQSEYFVGYLTLLMFAAVGGVPFRAVQAAAMCLCILVLMLVIPVGVSLFGPQVAPISPRQAIYWLVSSAILTAIAQLVYRSRHAEFSHRREIELAEMRVRKHAEDLERSTAELEVQKRTTEEQAEKLRQLEALKSRFFAGISHEFRTPITLILGPSKDALDKYGPEMDPELREAFGMIQRSGHRLHDLVDQLLDLSRLESGRLPLHATRQDVGAFSNGVVSVFTLLAATRDIELIFENRVEDAEIWFDSEHLYKVFSNLLSNALKFSDNGGRVRVKIEEGSLDGEDAVSISIKDNGIGIPEEHLTSVFDRFHRVENKTGSAAGTGIGLALVKELVELHGGTIGVTSEQGFGSEFTVTLRRGSEYLIEHGYELLTEQPPHLATIVRHNGVEGFDVAVESSNDSSLPTILVVEDNDDMRRYLRSILHSRYYVLEATDGREGLRKAVTELPALVLTDIMMPEMNGLALCSALKEDEQTSHIPVVILTAKASHEALIEGLSSGADDYITKPFDATELIIRTENLIEIRNLLLKKATPFEPDPSEIDEPSADEVFGARVAEIVETHLGDSNFTVDWMADEVGLSRRQLERRLKKISRLTPAGFIRLMRLKRAAQLLEQNVGSVSEVSYRVGFSDPNYFSRLFHQTFGVPPSEYPDE